MAVKHVKEYYDQVCANYIDLIKALEDLTDECNKNIVSPEKVENFKQMVEPVKNNYLTLSYIMFLLNMPNRKEKQSKYKKQEQKRLSKIPHENTKDGILEENELLINKMKSL